MNDQRQQSAGTERVTETQGGPPSPEAAGNDPVAAPGRTGRTRPEPVTTLSDYFVRKTTRPPRFLKDLTEGNVWEFSHEDVRVALENSRTADPRFTRTIALAAAALQADDDRFRRPLLAFVWESAQQRLRDNHRYLRADLAGTDPTHRLHETARALEPGLHEAKRRVESLNLLMATALWLHHTEGLELDVITEQLVAAVRDIPRLRRRSQTALAGHLADQSRSGTKGVLPTIGIVEPWIRRFKETSVRANSEGERADSLAEELTSAESRAQRAEAENDQLSAALETARKEAARAQEQLDAARIHFDHGSGQLRSRIAASLDGRLRDLLGTAHDALTTEQPRVHVAEEKIDLAVEELRKQVEWLRSSD